MSASQQRREDERTNNGTVRSEIVTSRKNAGTQPDVVPSNEETEGATGALETPATPPEMAKDGKVDKNKGKDS